MYRSKTGFRLGWFTGSVMSGYKFVTFLLNASFLLRQQYGCSSSSTHLQTRQFFRKKRDIVFLTIYFRRNKFSLNHLSILMTSAHILLSRLKLHIHFWNHCECKWDYFVSIYLILAAGGDSFPRGNICTGEKYIPGQDWSWLVWQRLLVPALIFSLGTISDSFLVQVSASLSRDFSGISFLWGFHSQEFPWLTCGADWKVLRNWCFQKQPSLNDKWELKLPLGGETVRYVPPHLI